VAGLSLGGLVSLHFALLYPARTRALVLIDSGPGFKKTDAQARWTAQVEEIARRLEVEDHIAAHAVIEAVAAAIAATPANVGQRHQSEVSRDRPAYRRASEREEHR